MAHDRNDREEFLPEDVGPAPPEEDTTPAESVEALRDKWLRAAAEVENTRKRLTAQMQQARRFERESALRSFLPVLDSLDRALSAPGDTAGGWRDGVVAIRDQMFAVLRSHGVSPFVPRGERFDPHRHEAVSAVPAPGRQEGEILDVTEIGYVFDDGAVLRPAKVIVARS